MTQEATDMYTIMDYLKWRGDLSLDVCPFNEVDACILARFSYEPFEGIVSENLHDFHKIKEVCDALINKPYLHDEVIDQTVDIDFIRLVGTSKRFGEMRISGFVNHVDSERQTQFSACLIDLDGEQTYYVAYRGTDNTIIGWREDFNMGFEFPVPAQQMALDYFESVASAFKDGTFILGGHSKGGNLSIYAATYCKEIINDAISDVYNFDGPGFTERIMQTDDFKKIEDRIHTYVPEFSVVGMLLEHLEDYYVVHSSQSGMMEHETLSWEAGPNGFIYKESVSAGSRFVDQTFKEWVNGLDKPQREQFVETVYEVVSSSDAKTIAEFNINRAATLNSMIKAYNHIDEDTKKGFIGATKKLIESAGNVIKTSADKT